MIQTVEKGLEELGETDAINNPLVTEKVQWRANYLTLYKRTAHLHGKTKQ